MKKLSKIFAVVLCLALALSMLPMGAAAAATTAKVTDAAAIKAGGNFVLVAEYGGKYYAVKDTIQSKPDAVEVTVSGDSVTPKSGNLPVWTVAASGDGISLSVGTNFLAYNSSTNFKSATSAEKFALTARNDGSFTLTVASTLSGSTVRGLAFQWNNGNYRFAPYAISNDGDEAYSFAIQFFKVSGEQVDTREELPTTSGAIVDAIFGLQRGEALSTYYKYDGKITLTGVVSGDASWSDQYSNGEVNFNVKNSAGADKLMKAYKLVAGANTTVDDIKGLKTGDKVTISGSVVKNYNGTLEFDGCELVSFEKGQVVLPNLPTDTADVVDAIYALKAGEALNAYYTFEKFTLSGTIVGEATWSDQYNNGELTIKVDGTDKELLAYRFKAGEIDVDTVKALAEGDKVTFTVTAAKNYNGTFEMEYPVLTAVEKGDSDDTGDNTAIVAMTSVMVIAVAALAVLVINKKRMF